MSKGTPRWFTAEYHFPSTYSCRLPLSSDASALISPAPGPATVRLALIRVGIELFGQEIVRRVLFPWLCSARIYIRPPERVALSEQVFRAYKSTEIDGQVFVGESVVYREMAHAEGSMILSIELPMEEEERWQLLLTSVGYWGQANSFTTCLSVSEAPPLPNEYALPLRDIRTHIALQPFFSCILSEFRDSHLSWQDVVPNEDDVLSGTTSNFLKWEIYVWPLHVTRQYSRGKHLVRSPFL